MASIRKARIEDIQGLLDCQAIVLESLRGVLPNQFIEYEIRWLCAPDRKDVIEKAIEEKNMIILVGEEAGSIVGFAQGRVDRGGTSWLAYMGVIPAYRGMGIARELVNRYITESRAKGARKVSLFSAPELKPAIKLYVEMGFSTEGKIRRHIHGVDLVQYSKFLE